MGLGQIGCSEIELYDMTPRTFFNAQKGLFDAYQVRDQADWERSRWMACVLLNPHVKKTMQPKDLTTFPWEKRRRTKKKVEDIYKEAELFNKISEMKMNKKKITHG